MPPHWTAFIGVLGAIAGAFASVIVARMNARQAYYATDQQRQTSDTGVILQTWKNLFDSQQTRLDRVDAANAEMAKRIESLESHSELQDREIEGLKDRLYLWRRFGADLTARWHQHRLDESPPQLPEIPPYN